MPSAEWRVKRIAMWRARAEELRAIAATMRDPFCRDTLWRLAGNYDVMASDAELAEQKAVRAAG